MVDGGIRAISGFLYQLAGSAAVLAQAAHDPLVILHLEPSGEDALISNSSGKTLVQFKYSGSGHKINPGELREILLKLDEHDRGGNLCWKLSTNRDLSSAAEQLWKGTQTKKKDLANVTPKNKGVIERLGGKLNFEKLTLKDLDEQLSTRGRRFGLTEPEIRNGVAKILGQMMRLLTDNRTGVSVDLAFLDEHLVGFANPASLHGPDRMTDIANQLDRMANQLQGPSLDSIISRKSLEGLFELTGAAIAVVTGPGGCGKTLSVLRAIRDHVTACGSLGALVLSDGNEYVEEIVARWRRPKQYVSAEPLRQSIERLQIANPRQDDCVVVFGLDGVDESGWANRSHRLRELVSQINERSTAGTNSDRSLKVIFTCRRKQELELLLAGHGVGGDCPSEIEEIQLDLLTESELLQLWAKWFPELPPPRSVQTRRDLELLSEASGTITGLDLRVAEALRNPTFLGCFRSVTDADRHGVLSGDPGAWERLMEAYLNWFTLRVKKRRDIDVFTTRNMLIASARSTANKQNGHTYDLESHWIDPARDYTGCCAARAIDLFGDALTAGLITTDVGIYQVPTRRPVKWSWLQVFFEDFLRVLP